MNIQQAIISLSTVGTVDFCNVSGENDAFFQAFISDNPDKQTIISKASDFIKKVAIRESAIVASELINKRFTAADLNLEYYFEGGNFVNELNNDALGSYLKNRSVSNPHLTNPIFHCIFNNVLPHLPHSVTIIFH